MLSEKYKEVCMFKKDKIFYLKLKLNYNSIEGISNISIQYIAHITVQYTVLYQCTVNLNPFRLKYQVKPVS